MFPRHILYVSGECGAGKSYGARCYIKDNLFQQNFLYAAPSLHLVSEIAERLEKMGVTPWVITSKTHGKGVKKAIIEALKTAHVIGCCLLITWQAYAELLFFPKREEWQLIVDEIPRVHIECRGYVCILSLIPRLAAWLLADDQDHKRFNLRLAGFRLPQRPS